MKENVAGMEAIHSLKGVFGLSRPLWSRHRSSIVISSEVHELSQLTVHMQSLRALQQKLISSFSEETPNAVLWTCS